MASDWVKLHRSLMDSAVWADESVLKLWLWCILKANHKPGDFRGQRVERGQFVTGRATAADELGVSPSKWMRGVMRLVDLGCIKYDANSRWTTITVCNYSTYQDRQASDRTVDGQQMDSEWTTDGQQMDNRWTAGGHNRRREECKNNRMEEENKSAASGDSVSAPPKKTRPTKPAYDPAGQQFPPHMDTSEFRAAWQTWVDHRREIRKPLTPIAAGQCFDKCCEMGATAAIAAIKHSAGNGWAGLFPAPLQAGDKVARPPKIRHYTMPDGSRPITIDWSQHRTIPKWAVDHYNADMIPPEDLGL